MRLKVLAPAALIAVSALTQAGCGNSSTTATTSTTSAAAATGSAAALPTAPPAGQVSLAETGSTLLYPLFNLWDPAYHTQYSNVTITAQGTGSGTGISQASAGAVNIGASDAYLSSGQVAKTPSLLNIPLAISAQQINYNIPNFSGTLKLNGMLLSEIYQGKITNWDAPQIAAVNPGAKLPNLKIVPVHRSDGSGDTFLFTQYLSKQDASGWGNSISYGTTVSFPAVAGALAENGNGGMVSGCAATPGCVAYIGISYLKQTQSKHLGEAEIANASGNYELPTATTIGAEASAMTAQTPANETLSMIDGPAPQGYPIINYEYAIVNSKQSSATTATALQAFLGWALTAGNASSYLDQVDFQPLPAAIVKLSDDQLAKITG
ncbi:phosphate ABC transporter substrate-binding protein PstS [Actinospica sp. MGRD01-02]|uniref:Phosphate-binding protein n=1 Tax=Actinospica acidithermotolerans TaxID=2828514 RepID=A0A941E8E8_9ACTN|nr:phosphate ABC transporter substrate-binding protein PstS [Actinospica acidithermotolerans]MBR7828215.1 phosphate ABC transporter substrate-binding protein PstS [Actinospica acidithermotolerans]